MKQHQGVYPDMVSFPKRPFELQNERALEKQSNRIKSQTGDGAVFTDALV